MIWGQVQYRLVVQHLVVLDSEHLALQHPWIPRELQRHLGPESVASSTTAEAIQARR